MLEFAVPAKRTCTCIGAGMQVYICGCVLMIGESPLIFYWPLCPMTQVGKNAKRAAPAKAKKPEKNPVPARWN